MTLNHETISETLRQIMGNAQKETNIGEFCALFGERSLGLILLIFALPNTIPLPVPGISTLTSMPLFFFAGQLALGRQTLWLPKWLAERPISTEKMILVVTKTLPWIEKIEKVIRPRWHRFTEPAMERITGAVIMILAGVLLMPIPLGNLFPGIAVSVLALAVIAQDGALMVIGWVCSLIAIVFIALLISGYAYMLWRAVTGLL